MLLFCVEIFMAAAAFAFGLAITIKGADLFVRAATWVSDVTAISKAVIGATLIAFATSAPEFFVSLLASIHGHHEMSTSNIVGSVICNLGIGFAIIATFQPHPNADKLFAPNGIVMILATAFVFVAAVFGALTIWHALVLLALAAVFVFLNIKYAQHEYEHHHVKVGGKMVIQAKRKEKRQKKPTHAWEIAWYLSLFAVGLAALVLGSEMVVQNAEILAEALGVPERIIGLTVVAVGTSLPEVLTTIVAIVKRESGLSIGNIVGSNIFDITVVVAAMVFASGGFSMGGSTVWFDLPAAVILAFIAIVPTLIWRRVSRWQGLSIAAVYLAYVTAVIALI